MTEQATQLPEETKPKKKNKWLLHICIVVSMLGAWGLLFWFVQASDRFELPVIWWMFLISQFFGLINAGIAVYRYQTKNKEKTLKMAAIGNIFKVFNYVFIFNWSLAGLKVISIFKNLFFAETSKGKMKLWQSLLILIIFSLISAAVVFWSWWYTRLWFEWVILGVTILSNFGKWAKGIHIHRVTSVIYRVAMIINSVYYYLNLTNLIKAVFVIATIIVFYVRLLKEKITSKKQKKIETEVQDGI